MRFTLLALTALVLALLSRAAHAETCIALKSGVYENAYGRPFEVNVSCRKVTLRDVRADTTYRFDLDSTAAVELSQAFRARALDLVAANINSSSNLDGFIKSTTITGNLLAAFGLSAMARAPDAGAINLTFRAPFEVQIQAYEDVSKLTLTLPQGMELLHADIPLEGALKEAFITGANTVLSLFGSGLTGQVHEELNRKRSQ